MTYTVTVTHEDGWWLASVNGLAGAHTEARTLGTLDTYVREVIVLATDLPDQAMPDLDITYEFDQPPLETAARIAVRRRRLEQAHARVVAELAELARELVAAGYSTRDAAAVLGVTPGRISQITGAGSSKSRRAGGARRSTAKSVAVRSRRVRVAKTVRGTKSRKFVPNEPTGRSTATRAPRAPRATK
jgi:hypothetical protein